MWEGACGLRLLACLSTALILNEGSLHGVRMKREVEPSSSGERESGEESDQRHRRVGSGRRSVAQEKEGRALISGACPQGALGLG